jgi:hypothetical protein
VRAAWEWTRRKILDFLTDQGRPPDISNSDILLVKCTLLLGTYETLGPGRENYSIIVPFFFKYEVGTQLICSPNY